MSAQLCFFTFVESPCDDITCLNYGHCEYSMNEPYHLCKCLNGSSGDICEGYNLSFLRFCVWVLQLERNVWNMFDFVFFVSCDVYLN